MNASLPTKVIIWLLVIVIVAVPIELGAYLVGKVLNAQHLLLDEPSGKQEDYAKYLEIRDPILGWPSPGEFGNGEYASDGTRVDPESANLKANPCIAVFGDSFTWGDEVAPEDAYPSVLAQRTGCRVANYGVRGYGSDQAVIRYMENKTSAPVVILGHFADNIIRNVNQLRDLVAGTQFGFKPRYVLRNQSLQLVKLPTLDWSEYEEVFLRTEALLPEEYFVPDRYETAARFTFPYTLSIVRSLRHHRVLASLQGEAPHARFYKSDHPSKALDVTVALLTEFSKQAVRNGQSPLVLLIPGEIDLRNLQQGHTTYAELARQLAERGLQQPNVAAEMNRVLKGRDPCELYTACGGSRHFNPEGYRLLADIVFDWLQERKLIEEKL